MTCPVCSSSGFISVRSTERTGPGQAEHRTVARPCPMGCTPPTNGVTSDRLKGNEMTLEQLVTMLSEPDDDVSDRKQPSDYSTRKRGHSINDYYGFKS